MPSSKSGKPAGRQDSGLKTQDPPCHKCGKESCVYLAHARLNFCKKHFVEYFEKKVFGTVREFSLIKKGEKVGVGLSGGKDSSVMLTCLKKLQKKMPFELFAITVDEGIRGYRSSSVKIAKDLCKKLSVPLKIVSFAGHTGKTLDEILKGGVGKTQDGRPKTRVEQSCSFCGVFRRYLLNKAAKALCVDKLAIGHNLDDFAQTALMNMMRNEPVRFARFGIKSGILEDGGFVNRIKPLARLTEKEVAIYAVLTGISLHGIECPYAGYAFRQKVRDMLNEMEERYPGTKQRIFASYLVVQKALEKEYSGKDLEIKSCKVCGEPASTDTCMNCRMLERI